MIKPRTFHNKIIGDAIKGFEDKRNLNDVVSDIQKMSVKTEAMSWADHNRTMQKLFKEKRELESHLTKH